MSKPSTLFEKKQFYQSGELIYRYLISLPPNYSLTNTSYPLLIFMHGKSECGDEIERTKRCGIPRLIQVYDKWRNGTLSKEDLMTKDFKPQPSNFNIDPALKPPKKVNLEAAKFLAENFITITPQAGNFEFEPDLMMGLIEEIEQKYRVDSNKISLTGLSYGGYYTYDIAIAYPEKFAALVPICGASAKMDLKLIKNIPTWIFHGEKDEAMPIKYAKDIYDKMNKLGCNVQFTVFPDAYHDSFTQTYNKLDLYQWLISQKKSGMSFI